MAQKDPPTDTATKSTASITSVFAGLGETGKQRVEAAVAVQAELFDELREMNQLWFARAKSEADLASDLVAKLTSAHSVPESTTACREWATRRMEMAVEDGQHLLADSFKLMQTAGRLYSNGAVHRPG